MAKNQMTATADVYGVQITSKTGSLVTGVFKFDGRLKAGQGADFTYVPDPGTGHAQGLTWQVLINRGTSVVRRVMKNCEQKNIITVRLKAQLDDMLSDQRAHSEAAAREFVEEFDVETERELAAKEEFVNIPALQPVDSPALDAYAKKEATKEIKIAAQKFEQWQAKRALQNAASTQVTSDDLLEIPDFLKRTF